MADVSNPGSANSLTDWLLLNARDPSSSNSSLLLSVCWSLAGVSGVILALRLYTAARIIQHVRIEDYLMVMAWICGVIHTSLLTAAAYWGLGRHMSSLSPEQLVNTMKFVVICQVFGIASPTFGRISFSIYLFQFVMFERKRRRFLHFCIWSQVVVNVLTAVLIYVQCGRYPSAMWDRSIKADCWSPVVQRDFGFFQRSWNSFTDLYLTIMPATIVYKLQLSRAKKFGVSLLLGVSVFACVTSMINGYMARLLGQDEDETWDIAMFHLWAAAENYTVVIGGSIPTLTALGRRATRTSTYDGVYEVDHDGSHHSKTSGKSPKAPSVSVGREEACDAGL